MTEGLDTPCQKLHDALSRIVRDEETGMVTKWVAVLEVVGEDGQPAMWSLSSPGLSMWDQLGLVEFQSRTIAPEIKRDD